MIRVAAVIPFLWVAGMPGLAQTNAELSRIQFVYFLPMSGGLDQYLANRIVGAQVLEVVTDPKKADAVVTGQLGAPFEATLAELYPPPPKAAEPAGKEDEAKKEEAKKAAEEGELKGDVGIPKSSSFQRGRGNVFVVDIKSRRVLWSIYEPPSSLTPKDLDRAARRIADALKKAVQGK
jgi:hypothetical protein